MKLIIRLLFLLYCLVQPYMARASTDFQLWSEIGLKYKISDSFRVDLDGHLRMEDNASRIKNLMPELSLRYKLLNFMRLKAGYRNLNKPDYDEGGTYYTWHRFFFDVLLRHRIKPFIFRYRLRYQEQFHIAPDDGTDDSKYRHTLRNKVSIGWKAGFGFEPYVAGEFFNRFGDKNGLFRKWRATIGCEYEIDSYQLSIFYRIDDIQDNPYDPTAHILGFSCHYSF